MSSPKSTKASTQTPEERLTVLQTEFDTRAIAVDPQDRWGGATGFGCEIWSGRDHEHAVYRVMPAFGELPSGYESRNAYVVSAVTHPNTGEIVPIVAKFGFKVDELDAARKTSDDSDKLTRSYPRLLSFVTEVSVDAADDTCRELRLANLGAAEKVRTASDADRRSKYFG